MQKAIIRQLVIVASLVIFLIVSGMLDPLLPMLNSLDPSDTRDLPFIGFAVVFIGLFFLGPVLKIAKASKQSGKQQTPMEQALAQEKWRDNRIKSNVSPGLLGIFGGGFLLLFTGTFSAATVAPTDIANTLQQGEVARLLVYLLPAAALVILVRGIRAQYRYRTTPQDSVQLSPFPGQIGGLVAGTLEIPAAQGSPSELMSRRYQASLQLMKTTTSGSGKDRRTHTALVSEKQVDASTELSAVGQKVGFSFKVPQGFPQSRHGSRNGYWYQLKITSTDGDYSNTFEIPVFKPTEPLEDIQPSDPTANTSPQREAVMDSELGLGTASISEHSSVAHPFNAHALPIKLDSGLPKLSWVFGLVGCIFAIIGVVMMFVDDAPVIFPLVFTPVGVLIAIVGLRSAVTRYHTEINADTVTHTRVVIGKPKTPTVWQRQQLDRLHLVSGGSSTTNGRMTEYYQLALRTHSGKDLSLEFAIKGREQALNRMTQLSEQTGLPLSYDPLPAAHSLGGSQ